MTDFTFGANIRKKRKAFGETLEQLGEYLGYGKSAISMMETGKRKFPKDTYEKLCRHYFTTMDELTSDNSGIEYDWKNLEFTRPDPAKAAQIMFPVIWPKTDSIPDCFHKAVRLHKSIINDFFCPEKSSEPDGTDELETCHEKYLASLHYPEVRIYAKANLVSFFFFMAWVLTASFYSKDIPVSLLTKNYVKSSSENNSRINDSLFENAVLRLRQDFTSGHMSEYMEQLSNSPEFIDLGEYYHFLSYLFNLVPNDDETIINFKDAVPLFVKLINDENPYVLNLIDMISGVISVRKA